jgi:hypothetical protein
MESKPIAFTATSRAWLTGVGYQLRELQKAIEGREDKAVVESLCFSNHDMGAGSNPWACVGTAEITVTLYTRDSIVAASLAVLKKELDEERAKWLTKQKEILDQINSLQAIEMGEPA